MIVRNLRSGGILGDRIRDAGGFFGRLRGLLGASGLEAGEGLWIEPCTSVHMFGMRFAIDVAFVDVEGRVVRLRAGLRPWQAALGGRGARAVIELPTGALEASDTRVGDRLERVP